MPKCECVVLNRKELETQREWLKRSMCMHHWMQTDYYIHKLTEGDSAKLAEKKEDE